MQATDPALVFSQVKGCRGQTRFRVWPRSAGTPRGQRHRAADPGTPALAFVALLLLAGCSGPGSGGTVANTDQLTPQQVLDDTLAVYRQAPAYRDTVHLKLRYEVEGQPFDDATDLTFSLVRDKGFRAELKRAKLLLSALSSGDELKVQITHPETENFDRQTVARPAPSPLTVGSIYSATEYVDVHRPQQMVSFLEGTHLNLDDLPLALLLAEKPLAHLAADASKLSRKVDEKLDGRDCFRLAFATEAGDYVYWIEKKTHLVRRIEFPTGKLAAELVTQAEDQAKVTNISLWAEVENPEILPSLDLKPLPGAESKTPGRYFVYPPSTLPSRLFGRKIGPFAFQDLTGKEVNQTAFAGKISVLLWWNNHITSRKALAQLDAVHRQLQGHPRAQCFAVCAEPGVLNAGHIGAIVNQWRIQTPVLRDVRSAGRDVFQISDAPTCIVLDASGIVQLVEVGANPLLAQELPVILDRLIKGDNLAAELLKRQAEEQTEYQRQLATARGEVTDDVVPLDAALPAATLPRLIRVTPKWKSEIPHAGNILSLEGPPGEARAIVLSGGRQVVAIDEQGQAAKAVDLGLPEGAGATFLRAGRAADGSAIYASGAKQGQAAHFHDAQWRVTMSYPAAGQAADTVQDILLADLNGDKASEAYVGFWGEVGVHAVGWDGKTLWRNRVATPVLSLAPFTVSNRESLLLATSNRGLVLPINAKGKEGKAYQVGDKSLHLLVAARFPAPRASAYLGCSFLPDGGLVAVALDDELREAWSYPLPPGPYRTPIEFLQSGKLLDNAGAGQWVIAGADGSVHVLSDDGNFVDNYRTGKPLTGIAPFGKLLLLATSDGIEAVELSRAGNATSP